METIERDHNGMEILPRQECLTRIGTRGVGRIGLSIDALPAILPVNYAVDDGDIYFRSAPGAKLSAAVDGAVVAFEVDGTDATNHLGWSVLVVGRSEIVPPQTDMARTGRLPLTRWVGDAQDVLVRIRPDQVTGRRIVREVGHA